MTRRPTPYTEPADVGPHTARAASLCVAAHARDLDDLQQLLNTLGLDHPAHHAAANAEALAYYGGPAVRDWHPPTHHPAGTPDPNAWQHLRDLADALRGWHYTEPPAGARPYDTPHPTIADVDHSHPLSPHQPARDAHTPADTVQPAAGPTEEVA
jgi:hypothetical protein